MKNGGSEYDIVVPVWGHAFTRNFVDYSLASQLSPGNIPAISDRCINYHIHTTPADRRNMEAHPLIRRLAKYANITFSDIGNTDDKYAAKSVIYREAIVGAAERNRTIVPLNADIIFADGFFSCAAKLIDSGKKVIQVVAPRAQMDPFLKELKENNTFDADGVLSVPSLSLAGIWLRHRHSLLDMHFVDGKSGENFHPSHLYWSVGSEGIIARCFHLYPIVLSTPKTTASFDTTIDDNLVANLGVTADEVVTVKDSRNMFCCELSGQDHYVGHVCKRGEWGKAYNFLNAHSPYNFRNLSVPVQIFGEKSVTKRWSMVTMKSRFFLVQMRVWGNLRRMITLPKMLIFAALRTILPLPLKNWIKRLLKRT